MNSYKARFWTILTGLTYLSQSYTPSVAQIIYPGQHWQQYAEPAQAGWSVNQLEGAKRYADSIGLAATMIIHKGAVVASWGDVERKYRVHSIRKSFINALYGMSVRDGQIKLDQTLAQLCIDDGVNPLSPAEKQATVHDLLQARSGIFLPAAYEGRPQKPPRGSHPHGTFWLYNNWDFNVLGTILEQRTKRRFFDDLQQRVTQPLQMEDVDSLDAVYDYELERSQHPAYTFKMSTRDMARFGLLYMTNGRWKDAQLVPTSWVKESTQAYSLSDDGLNLGYGYLWWVNQGIFKDRGMYSAAGMGGHHIFVFPRDSVVVVVRSDTYQNKFVSLSAEYALLQKILAAKTQSPPAKSDLVPLPSSRQPSRPGFAPPIDGNRYVGHYQFDDEWMAITTGQSGLIMDSQFMGKLYLIPITESLFQLKDQENYISFVFDKQGKAIQLFYHDQSKLSHAKP
jgi:CubicO group peptidase (beta-lactamase class C family)